jgi:hypothetical protein
LKKVEGDKEESQIETLTRKVAMLEKNLEDKEKSWRESTDKYVELIQLRFVILTFTKKK